MNDMHVNQTTATLTDEQLREKAKALFTQYPTLVERYGRPDAYFLARGGRTGEKIHLARRGSSVLSCGHWTKLDVYKYFKVASINEDSIDRYESHLCERCCRSRHDMHALDVMMTVAREVLRWENQPPYR